MTPWRNQAGRGQETVRVPQYPPAELGTQEPPTHPEEACCSVPKLLAHSAFRVPTVCLSSGVRIRQAE